MSDIDIALLCEHPANVRERFEDLDDMAASIKAHGILQPLIVQPNPAEAGTSAVFPASSVRPPVPGQSRSC